MVNNYLAPANDTFYSASGSKKYWMPHQLPNLALVYYDSVGTVKYAVRAGEDLLPLSTNAPSTIETEILPANGNAIFLYGHTTGVKTTYFSDTVMSNGEDGILMKITPGSCDTSDMPPPPPRIYIKQPLYDVLCKGEQFTLHDTVIAPFSSVNSFVVTLFDYNTAGNVFFKTLDTIVGSTADSFLCAIPLNIPDGNYGLRIHATMPEYQSPILKVLITGPVNPVVSINAHPSLVIDKDSFVTFTATSSYAGSHPQYVWTVNGKNIINAIDSVYKTDSLHNNDTSAPF